jgi:hypothetical protein
MRRPKQPVEIVFDYYLNAVARKVVPLLPRGEGRDEGGRFFNPAVE